MIRALTSDCLGVAGRQNELIELALTYGFKGIDLDMEDMLRRDKAMGQEFACQFIRSAKINISSFELPIRFAGKDEDYAADCAQLDDIVRLCASIRATRCVITIQPFSDELPYHENFDRHRTRISEIADKLAAKSIKIGLAVNARPQVRANKTYQFVHNAEELVTLVRTVGNKNVGIAIDAWHWQVGDGAMDQITDLSVEQIVDVRLSDLSNSFDPDNVLTTSRALPSSTDSRFCSELLKHLDRIGYKGPIAAVCHPSHFKGQPREYVAQRIREALDQTMIRAGLMQAPVSSKAAPKEEEAEADEAESNVHENGQPVSTEA
jgi:sugar phosphate isomerase/epimerase